MELLESLWLTMTQTYGHRWTSSFGESPKADHAWAKVLTGITGKQIANGLHCMIERARADVDGWPPSAPEFRAMCLEVHGLPGEPDAWMQALRGEYGHEAVRIAAEATGTFELRTAKPDNKPLRQQFTRNYAIVTRRAQTGQALDGGIAKGLTHEQKTPMQVQLAQSEREARDLRTAQGIPSNGAEARKMLLARLSIKNRPRVGESEELALGEATAPLPGHSYRQIEHRHD